MLGLVQLHSPHVSFFLWCHVPASHSPCQQHIMRIRWIGAPGAQLGPYTQAMGWGSILPCAGCRQGQCSLISSPVLLFL